MNKQSIIEQAIRLYRQRILDQVALERMSQEELKKAGKFPHTAADSIGPQWKLAILMEEVGEVARWINEHPLPVYDERRLDEEQQLLRELIQVAAVAVAWIEGLDTTEKPH